MTMHDSELHDSAPEHEDDAETGREIAVIGMAGRFSKARDLERFWDNLRDGVESVDILPDEELLAAGVSPEILADPYYVKAASRLDGVEEFDAGFFDYRPREAEILDPQQRLFLEHAWHALENAGYAPASYDGLIGVYAGVAWDTYLLSNLTTHPELFAGAGGFEVFITNDKDFMPTRASYKLNLKGPSVIIQTSCSTSLVAVHMACLSLLSYECDMALAGGVTVKVPQTAGYYYQDGGLASPDGHCRPFDAKAAGTIFGSGIGMVVLKRLSEALEDGDPIRAVIKGSAINNDGSMKVSYTAPSVEGQAEVIAAAQEMAGVDPETIRYVETHGTGTSLGDPIEVTALEKVFREATDKRGFCALGSVKSNLGHLDAAAGVAGLIKTVLSLEHRQLPPSLHYEEPNPAIDFASSPFYVNAELADWPSDGGPRRAGVSSFGVGGTNAHVILEEAPPAEPSGESRPWQLLVLSARSETALEAATDQLLAYLRAGEAEAGPDADGQDAAAELADVAYTLRCGRAVFRHRRALVCRDRAEAIEILAAREGGGLLSAVDTEDPRSRPVVFLFPGQGSQYVGMARGLYEQETAFREAVDRCAEHLRPALGLDLRRVIWPAAGDDAETAARELGRTRLTQPALFVIGYALARLWGEWGVEPRSMIGHSIGEYVAACLSGVFSLEDALTLVAARGRLMDELPAGAMLAVPLPEEELTALLAEPENADLALAAINEPARSVVSGPEEAVVAFEAQLADRGLTGRRLHTSHAFHSRMMDPMLEAFTAEVRKVTLNPPETPFVSNVTGTWITAEQATDAGYWARHLRQAVRFADGIATVLGDGEEILLELGPGRVLSTLAGRHPERRGRPIIPSLPHAKDAGEDYPHVLAALGQLWLAGLDLDPRAYYAGEERRRVALPAYPFERRRYWIEAGIRHAATAGADVALAALGKRPEIADWFYLPSWKPSLPPRSSEGQEPPKRWLVLALPGGPGAALAARLEQLGCEAITVEPGDDFSCLRPTAFVLDPRQREHYDRLAGALDEPPHAVVHAWSVEGGAAGAPITTAGAFEAAQGTGFYSLLFLAQALARRAPVPELDVTVVTEGAERVAAEPIRPEKAPLLGLCRVLPQELPGVRCRAIDVAPGDLDEADLIERLIAEVTAQADDEVVAYRGRQRWVESFEPIRLPAVADSQGAEGEGDDGEVPAPLRARGVYLITGGLEGNGLGLARFLARTARARLVLLEQTSSSPDKASRHVAALEALGAEVMTRDLDLADVAAVRGVLAEAESRFGPVDGVIHTAGPIGERNFRMLGEIGDEECGWHFQPKVHAFLALEQAVGESRQEGSPPDFCLLLSSLASVVGGLGYGPYTAASRFLDAAGQQGSGRALPWRTVDWDVWEHEDEDEQITTIRADLAELAMSPGEGEEAFRRLLTCDVDRILVSTGDLEARLTERRQRIEQRADSPTATRAATGSRHPRPQLMVPYAVAESDLERTVLGVWEEILGFEGIGIDDNFFDLGGDSFAAVQVVSGLKDALEIDLPVAQLFQCLTVRALGELLTQDAAEKTEERSAHLAERRDSMDRRKRFQERRRSRARAVREA